METLDVDTIFEKLDADGDGVIQFEELMQLLARQRSASAASQYVSPALYGPSRFVAARAVNASRQSSSNARREASSGDGDVRRGSMRAIRCFFMPLKSRSQHGRQRSSLCFCAARREGGRTRARESRVAESARGRRAGGGGHKGAPHLVELFNPGERLYGWPGHLGEKKP